MCTQLQVVLNRLGVTSTLFWCKLTRIPRQHNTVLVFFYPIQIRIVGGLHYCGVNVHHVGVTLTLNWCSHSCKNLHFFGVTVSLSLFLWTFTLCSCLPVVLGMLGSMSNSAAMCFPRSCTSFQTDGPPFSALMVFITTLASWAASMRSTLFPCNIVDKATELERTYFAGHRAIIKSNCLIEHK